MEKNIKVSIIVPAYNVEGYIEDCLNSLIKQTLQEIEIIVINDGSTDKTGEIIAKFAKKDSRIIAITQENKGLTIGLIQIILKNFITLLKKKMQTWQLQVY